MTKISPDLMIARPEDGCLLGRVGLLESSQIVPLLGATFADGLVRVMMFGFLCLRIKAREL